VHGGYAAALLDSACGCAVHSGLNGQQPIRRWSSRSPTTARSRRVIRASANATRLPIETTLPSARTGPVVRRRRAAVRIGHVDAARVRAKELTHPDTHPDPCADRDLGPGALDALRAPGRWFRPARRSSGALRPNITWNAVLYGNMMLCEHHIIECYSCLISRLIGIAGTTVICL